MSWGREGKGSTTEPRPGCKRCWGGLAGEVELAARVCVGAGGGEAGLELRVPGLPPVLRHFLWEPGFRAG